jgi:hypothetical protein
MLQRRQQQNEEDEEENKEDDSTSIEKTSELSLTSGGSVPGAGDEEIDHREGERHPKRQHRDGPERPLKRHRGVQHYCEMLDRKEYNGSVGTNSDEVDVDRDDDNKSDADCLRCNTKNQLVVTAFPRKNDLLVEIDYDAIV